MKIIRTSTVPGSLDSFCNGLHKEKHEQDEYEVIAVSLPSKEFNTIINRTKEHTLHTTKLKDSIALWN